MKRSFIERAAKPRKASVGRGLFNLSLIAVFTTVQFLAAVALDGWLAWGLLVIAARNVVVFVLSVVGLAAMASEAVNRERGLE